MGKLGEVVFGIMSECIPRRQFAFSAQSALADQKLSSVDEIEEYAIQPNKEIWQKI